MFANRFTVTGRRGCCLLLLLLLLIGAVEQTAAQPYLTCLIEATNSHEAIVLPYAHSQVFDSAQLVEFLKIMPTQPKNFGTVNYTTLQWNTSYQLPMSADWYYPEAIYDTAIGGQVVAAGPVSFYNPEESVEADNHNDKYISRRPHVVGVRGHLFDGGFAVNTDTLLRINLWYKVDAGQIYRDSSGALVPADMNRRFLYRSIAFTKADFIPTNRIAPDYTEYREAFRRIDFRREGMGESTDTLVTAQDIDLEVVYVGGEKLALHSIAVRDSIYHLLTSPGIEGDTYRQRVLREIDTLLRCPLQESTWGSLHNLYLTDEPLSGKTAGSFHIRRMIHDFLYRRTPSNVYLPDNRSATTATIPDRTSP